MQSIIKKTCLVLLRAAAILIIAVLPFQTAGAMVIPSWTQTTQADFASGVLNQLDISTSPGDVKLAKNGSDYIYTFKGNGTKTFWKYDVAADTWSALTDAPQNVGAGGALAYDGGNYIYALGGNGNKYFWRYNISANTWSSLASVTNPVNAGGALAYDGTYIYAFRGGNKSSFYRYSISGDYWTSKASAPASVKGGGALAYGGNGYIYALGGMSTYFWKYSISGNTWTLLAATPSSVGDGGSLAAEDSQYVYALKGDNTVTFWRYAIDTNSWVAMADTPATPCVYGGGALVYDGAAHLFALRGNNQDDFWKYSVAGNAWSIIHDTPAPVAYGGAMAYKAVPYYGSGTLTSSTFDTGYNADFNSISWNAVTPAGTAVQFQIATNSDNATWVFKGPDGTTGTYYTSSGTNIWSGHDGDRFIKYKAFLSTTDTKKTPVLNDISISYTQLIILPSATTNAAASIEETSATLNGLVADDGGQPCQYRFVYGTAAGGPYPYSTNWTGSLSTGQAFNAGVMSLAQGTLYFYQAEVKNTIGTGSGSELDFLTKPEAPDSFMASVTGGTQVDLNWTKGAGADRTKVMRKTGGYPANYNDGTEVYFNTGASVSDAGLAPNTSYYYRAWSEVTAGSYQQWSDDYKSVSIVTGSAMPAAFTDNATLVEETSATLHGMVTFDGGETCEYQFVYGTVPGGPYPYSTGWTGSVTNGDAFLSGVTGLAQGTKYYYLAQVKNTVGTGSGVENEFLTKPEAPFNHVVTVDEINATEISLSWTKGLGAEKTMIRRQTGSYPADRTDGVQVYFDTGTSCIDSGLDPDTLYYYRAWSQVSGSEQWSDGYDEFTVQTSLLIPPTTIPPTTTPPPTTTVPVVSVGGTVNQVNKAEVLAPWLAGFVVLVAVTGGVIIRVVRARKKL